MATVIYVAKVVEIPTKEKTLQQLHLMIARENFFRKKIRFNKVHCSERLRKWKFNDANLD